MIKENPVVLRVVLPVPLRSSFDYLPPKQTLGEGISLITPEKGQRVLVPFGRQTLIGIIVEIGTDSEFDLKKLKPAIQIFEEDRVFDNHLTKLLDWAAKYYQHPIGEVYSTALPGALRASKTIQQLSPLSLYKSATMPSINDVASNATQLKKLIELLAQGSFEREELTEAGVKSTTIKKFVEQQWASWKTPEIEFNEVCEHQIEGELQLNTEQAIAVSAINQCLQFSCFLLDGITGSGKTEVYLQAIKKILLQQQQVLVLVPEIGLTPQTISRFKKRFSVDVTLWHSGMTDKQRFSTWYQARTGKAKIVISTRSGVFLPFKNLGLIVMDEEHDASFKQAEGFKYHCRSLALYRANQLNIPIILGTATPSLETLLNAQSGKYQHLTLRQRAAGSLLPEMRLLDLNRCQVNAGIGHPLLEQISARLKAKQQVMLFINRRGFAPVLMCEECHWLTDCHRCSSYMTFHKGLNRLICHHCGHQQMTVRQCGGCGSTRIIPVGLGTEQLELSLQELFPNYPTVRLDRDSTSKKGAFDALLEDINKGEPQIIIGTQMIAKGHHFPNVSLVGIVDVDGALFSSDFRAAEKLAQLIVQVSGRAGRGSIKGQVWLQTKFPEHPVIQDLVNNHYEDFAKFALSERQMMHLPPYSHHIALRAESSYESLGAEWLAQLLPHLNQYENLLCLGPTPAPMMKKAGKYRFILTIQCRSRSYLHKIVNWLIQNLDTLQKDNRIRWSIDVDPIDLS